MLALFQAVVASWCVIDLANIMFISSLVNSNIFTWHPRVTAEIVMEPDSVATAQ